MIDVLLYILNYCFSGPQNAAFLAFFIILRMSILQKRKSKSDFGETKSDVFQTKSDFVRTKSDVWFNKIYGKAFPLRFRLASSAAGTGIAGGFQGEGAICLA
jgi:hypothetical protein